MKHTQSTKPGAGPDTPDWVADAIFYQIFPDRFAISERVHKPGPLEPWDAPPTVHGFKGGDLLGVVEHLDHLLELGVNAIYLNPVFSSASNHRYHTYDYYQVDPLLGGNEALRALLDAAHERGIRVILDGVFNHASRGFWPFHHLLEAGAQSPYVDWFYVHAFPLRAYDDRHKPNYAAWWNLKALPKLNVGNAEVRAMLLDVAEHWIHFGADGWRLDVPDEIDDVEFWQEFRQRVRAANAEAYLVGEIWRVADDWLQGDRFDALMNYPLTFTALGFFAAATLNRQFKPGGYELRPLAGDKALEELANLQTCYHPNVVRSQLNLLDSHDTPRFLTMAGGDHAALHLATLMQMTLPGAPSIYYGSEIGLHGGADPDCRRSFPWDRAQWHEETWDWTRAAIQLRRSHDALRHGSFLPVFGHDQLLAYLLLGEADAILVAFNAGREAAAPRFSLPGELERDVAPEDVWQPERALQAAGWGRGQQAKLTVPLPPRSARVLRLALAG